MPQPTKGAGSDQTAPRNITEGSALDAGRNRCARIVADPKQVEIELGYFTLERENDENKLIIPRVVLNYGLFQNWEVVAEFAIRHDGGELSHAQRDGRSVGL